MAFITRHTPALSDSLFDLPTTATALSQTRDNEGHPYILGVNRVLPPHLEGLVWHGGGVDASSMLWSILLSAAHAHWKFADVLTVVNEPGIISVCTRSGGNGGRRARHSVQEFLARQWARAVRMAATSSTRGRQSSTTVPLRSQVINDYITAQLAVLQDDEWFNYADGHAAAALRVYVGLCVLTQQATRFDVGADVRRLAQLTGMSIATVSRALRALKDRGYIFLVNQHYGTYANVWSIRENTDASTVVENRETQGCTPAPEGEAFLDSLNISSRLNASTHDAFWGRPVMANDYGDVVVTGSAVEDLHSTWNEAFVGKTLDEIARLRGTTGVLLVQVLRHEAERLVWSWWTQELEFLRKKGERIFHYERQEWFTGKRAMSSERFPRRCGVPDFGAALAVMNAELGGF